MKRRTSLKTILAGAGSLAGNKVMRAATLEHPIQLHVDLAVDPAKEQEMLHNFKTSFRPAASKQPGYIDVQMLKLRSAIQGKAPDAGNYRFVLTFVSEEQRQKWIASDDHAKNWPPMEAMLTDKNFGILVYDVY